jgi:hypothetical protein
MKNKIYSLVLLSIALAGCGIEIKGGTPPEYNLSPAKPTPENRTGGILGARCENALMKIAFDFSRGTYEKDDYFGTKIGVYSLSTSELIQSYSPSITMTWESGNPAATFISLQTQEPEASQVVLKKQDGKIVSAEWMPHTNESTKVLFQNCEMLNTIPSELGMQ